MSLAKLNFRKFLGRTGLYGLVAIIMAAFPLTWYAAGSGSLEGMFEGSPWNVAAVAVCSTAIMLGCPFFAFKRGFALEWYDYQYARATKERKTNVAYQIPETPLSVKLLEDFGGAETCVALIGFATGLIMVAFAAY